MPSYGPEQQQQRQQHNKEELVVVKENVNILNLPYTQIYGGSQPGPLFRVFFLFDGSCIYRSAWCGDGPLA